MGFTAVVKQGRSKERYQQNNLNGNLKTDYLGNKAKCYSSSQVSSLIANNYGHPKNRAQRKSEGGASTI